MFLVSLFLHYSSFGSFSQTTTADPPWLQFVKIRPANRTVLLLSSLRKESVSVLYQLGVFFPHYDVDDEYKGPVPDRPRILRSSLAQFQPGFMVPPSLFQPGYDIDDFEASSRTKQSMARALDWRDQVKEWRTNGEQ